MPPSAPERPDRRSAILAAAEALFAERGYAYATTRDIASAAGVPTALIAYYFGTKEVLFETIFEHRKAYGTDRVQRIQAVDLSAANPDRVENLVRAWAAPVVELRERVGETFPLLVARTTWDPGPEARAVIERFYSGVDQAFAAAMAQALPGRSQEAIQDGYRFAVAALLMHVADRRAQRPARPRSGGIASASYGNLVRCITAAFLALPEECGG